MTPSDGRRGCAWAGGAAWRGVLPLCPLLLVLAVLFVYPLARVLANRALYDRSELQERGVVAS